MESFGTLLTSHGAPFEFNIFFISDAINMLILLCTFKKKETKLSNQFGKCDQRQINVIIFRYFLKKG